MHGRAANVHLAGLLVYAALAIAAPAPALASENLAPYAPPEQQAADGVPSPSAAISDPEEKRAFALRLQNRLSGRLSLAFDNGIAGPKHQAEIGPTPAARILIGYRRNVMPRLGYHLRGGPVLGYARMYNPTDRGGYGPDYETTWMMGASADGVFLFGPFGRFFVGPLLCLDYIRFSDTTVKLVDATVHLKNGFTAGGGFDIGGTFGDREQVIIYQSLRMTAGTGEAMIFLLFGIGYLR